MDTFLEFLGKEYGVFSKIWYIDYMLIPILAEQKIYLS